MNNWFHQFLNWFYPVRCPFCGQIIKEVTCPVCRTNLPFIGTEVCRTCGLPHKECKCLYREPKVDEAVAPFFYEGAVRSAILRMKKGNAGLHVPLAGYMAICLDRLNGSFDFITCIPQSPKSAQVRGFNQAALLAKRVSALSGIPFAETMKCVRHQTAQKTLNASERASNVTGIFHVTNPGIIKGKNLLLIDDIKTSGSTSNEAASVLKEAGAEGVSLLCVAITRYHYRSEGA